MERTKHAVFVMLTLASCKKASLWNQWKRNRWKKRDCSRMLKKLIRKEKLVSVMGIPGINVELPFSKEEAEQMNRKFLDCFIEKILEYYGVETCYFERDLYFMKEKTGPPKDWLFRYLLFRDGMDLFLEQCNRSKKDARYIVIDSGDQKVEMILQSLIPDANQLTIVTGRPDFFRNAVDEVLEATGLIMDIISFPVEQILRGNVIVFLNKEQEVIYKKFEQDALVIDLSFSERKFEYICSRRKDLTVLYDYEIDFNGETIDKKLAAEALSRDSWKLKRFVERPEISMMPEEMKEISDRYGITVKSLKLLQPYKSILD